MMIPMHTDLMKYSTPAALTSHVRQALRIRRKTRRAAFFAFIVELFSHASRPPMMSKRPHISAQS